MKKTIFTGFAENATWSDGRVALSVLFSPSTWQTAISTKNYIANKEFFQKLFSTPFVSFFDSGRSALFVALQVLDTKPGDEILVPAYTCAVVINAIRAAGGTPVYVDIQPDLNIDPSDLERKITEKSTCILLQHTFGAPASVKKIQMIALQHKLRIIEDCAHALGGKWEGQLLGTFGDITLLSFGSDKIVSSVRGGALLTSSPMWGAKIQHAENTAPLPHSAFTLQHILHPLVFLVAKPLYQLGIGKILLKSASELGLTARLLTESEKQGGREAVRQLSEALSTLLHNQLKRLYTKNTHRQDIARVYRDNLPQNVFPTRQAGGVYLGVPILVDDPVALARTMKQRGIILGTAWYGATVVPKDVNQTAMQYEQGSCPHAEALSRQVLLLPNHEGVSLPEAKEIATQIKTLLHPNG